MKSFDVRRLAVELGYEVSRIKEGSKFRWYVRTYCNSKYVMLGCNSDEACAVLSEMKRMRGYA